MSRRLASGLFGHLRRVQTQQRQQGDVSMLLRVSRKKVEAPNWLPAPDGHFALFMRAYLPKIEMLEGDYHLPPIEPVFSPGSGG